MSEAMEKAKARLRRVVTVVQQEFEIVSATFKDRGWKRFSRALALGGVFIFIANAGINKPLSRRLEGLTAEIEKAKTVARYADQYKTAHDRLLSRKPLLAPLKDKNSLLTSRLVESLKDEKIEAEALAPPEETHQSGLVVQTVHVTFQASFPQLVAWLNRLNNRHPLFHVTALDVNKSAPGWNKVTCAVSAVFAEKEDGP